MVVLRIQVHGRLSVRLAAALLSLLLAGCNSLPPVQTTNEPALWQAQQQSLSYIEHWALRGRLNVRTEAQNDTVSLNWEQDGDSFDIRFSGSLGLGAVAVHGDPSGVVVEKSGEAPLNLDSLDALSQEYLDFYFPASHLQFWVRGLPVPQLAMSATWNEQAQLSSLTQTDAQGERWQLTYDRYKAWSALDMPGRIRMQRGNIRLTFFIDDWQLQPALFARL